jgi:hypothetical protein
VKLAAMEVIKEVVEIEDVTKTSERSKKHVDGSSTLLVF